MHGVKDLGVVVLFGAYLLINVWIAGGLGLCSGQRGTRNESKKTKGLRHQRLTLLWVFLRCITIMSADGKGKVLRDCLKKRENHARGGRLEPAPQSKHSNNGSIRWSFTFLPSQLPDAYRRLCPVFPGLHRSYGPAAAAPARSKDCLHARQDRVPGI